MRWFRSIKGEYRPGLVKDLWMFFYENELWDPIMWVTEQKFPAGQLRPPAPQPCGWCLGSLTRAAYGPSSCRCSYMISLLYVTDHSQDSFKNLISLRLLSLSQTWIKSIGDFREEGRTDGGLTSKWTDRKHEPLLLGSFHGHASYHLGSVHHRWQTATHSNPTTYPKSHSLFSPCE